MQPFLQHLYPGFAADGWSCSVTPPLCLQCTKEPEKPLYGGGIVSDASSSAGGKKLPCPIKGSVLKVDLKKDHHYALSGNQH